MDQEGQVVARMVIVVAVAVRRRLDHTIGVVVAAPHPGPYAFIVERIVRRRIGERPAHGVAAVVVGVALAGVLQPPDPGPGRGTQPVGRRRVDDRCSGRGGQIERCLWGGRLSG